MAIINKNNLKKFNLSNSCNLNETNNGNNGKNGNNVKYDNISEKQLDNTTTTKLSIFNTPNILSRNKSNTTKNSLIERLDYLGKDNKI